MKRAVQARACAAAATALCALTLGLGTAVSTSGTAYAAVPQDVQIPAPNAVVPRDVSIVAAGQDGVLEQEEGTAGYAWISTANRQVTHVSALDAVPRDAFLTQATDADEVVYTTNADGPTQVVWMDPVHGTELARLTLQDGYLHPHPDRRGVIVAQQLDGGGYQYRIVRPGSSGTDAASDVVLPLPEGATGDADPVILANSGVNFVVGYQQDGHRAYGFVNVVSGTLVPLTTESDASSFSFTDAVGWFSRQGTAGERFVAAADPGTSTPVVWPLPQVAATGEVHTFQVGDHVVWYEGDHGPLKMSTGPGPDDVSVLLPDVSQVLQEPKGDIDAVSTQTDLTRTVEHLSADGAGAIEAQPLRTLPPVTYYGSVQAVSLDRGTVRFANSLRGGLSLVGKDIGTGLTPADGPDLPAQDVSGPDRFADGGDEGLARLVTDPATGHDALVTADDPAPVVLSASGGRILDVSPQYVLYQAGNEQYVVDIAQNRVVRQQTAQAAALDYGTLWTASTSAPGTVIGADLLTGRTRTVDLGGGCVPADLRTNGTLMFWLCHRTGSDIAAVRDLTNGQSYFAPSTADVQLGDHFLAVHPQNTTQVDVYGLHDGIEQQPVHITGLKGSNAAVTRGVTWAVDRRSGEIAYVDASDTVHVARALADTTHVSPLTVPRQAVPATAGAMHGSSPWTGQWWLSKPGAGWRLDLAYEATGAAVRSWTGNEARSSVKVSWDASPTSGAVVVNGTYTWKLTVAPADGSGPASVTQGTVAVSGGAPGPSGLFARDTTGALWQYAGTGKASAPYGPREKVGGGWQIYNALATLNGYRADGSGVVVARDSAGVLWYYQGSGSYTPPLRSRAQVGSGWNIYDRLVGVRDVTGDGTADLIARDASGVLWLYPGTGSVARPFAARVRIGAGWNAYGMLVGTGDVTGDGRADVVARDASGVLWLYRGTGSASAPFAARVRIGAGWNAYGMLVGTGDVTGDGRADVVARDASGVLWLYRGRGSASAPFAARAKIGAGWNTYNALM